MKLLNSSKNVDKKMAYKLSHQTRKMSELVGAPVNIEAWVNYLDEDKKTGEEKEVVSVLVEGEAYATISESFIREFKDIVDVFEEDEAMELKVISGKTKNNRDFLTVTIG